MSRREEQPPVTNQQRKLNLSLAGEFFVAAELQRRDVMASVTYGNAKKADVVAFSPETSTAQVIEAKSTSQRKWVVGNKNPEPSEDLWVLVHIPENSTETTRYFILTAREIHGILKPGEVEYCQKYIERHGHEPTGVGVYSVRLNQVDGKQQANGTQLESCEGKWDKILSRVTTNV